MDENEIIWRPDPEVAARTGALPRLPHLRMPHFIDLHDPRVDQRRRRPRFVVESLNVDRVARQLGVEHLECHLPSEGKLLGQIDLGHRPLAEPAEHVVILQGLANQFAQGTAPSHVLWIHFIVCSENPPG